MGIPDACVVEMSRVPEDLVCSVCSELCSDPVQTPCNHVFCRICINVSVPTSGACPMCRAAVTTNRLNSISDANPILCRIWRKILVRCPNAVQHNCEWTGSSADFGAHKLCCKAQAGAVSADIDALRKECSELRIAVGVLQQKLSQEQREREGERFQMAQERASEQRRLERERERLRNHVEFDPNYRYDRFRAVELSQLISRFLMEKPPEINANRVYNCVKNICDDVERGWADNPEHLTLVPLTSAVAPALPSPHTRLMPCFPPPNPPHRPAPCCLARRRPERARSARMAAPHRGNWRGRARCVWAVGLLRAAGGAGRHHAAGHVQGVDVVHQPSARQHDRLARESRLTSPKPAPNTHTPTCVVGNPTGRRGCCAPFPLSLPHPAPNG
jgi:hypothetical protein